MALVSQGKGFSDVVTAQMSQCECSRSSAQRDCRWAHDQLQLSIDSHDAQHLMVHMATSLQRISLKAEEGKRAIYLEADPYGLTSLREHVQKHRACRFDSPLWQAPSWTEAANGYLDLPQ
ncbi:hypothetical protein Syncc8109_0614 [Synechococcus sp. WH 8109]|nr:hypothetical protein Syncc8109_0614 [Synechococcus sp. WH 8109]